MENNNFPYEKSLKLQTSFCLNGVARDFVPISTAADAMNCTPKFSQNLNMKIWKPGTLFFLSSSFLSSLHELGDCRDWICLRFVTKECCALVSSIKI